MMNARIWSAACGAIVCGAVAGVLAQAPASQSSADQQSLSAKSVTVTGCVQQAQQSPTGTSGTMGGAATTADTKFVLTNAAVSKSPTATGTSGAEASTANAIASEYRLDASESKLSAHVGHKVEVTGTIEQVSPNEQKPTASAAVSPTLKVDSVKMIASSCTPQ
jgi:hypothetical protein